MRLPQNHFSGEKAVDRGILGGVSQNVAGMVVAGAATFAAQIAITRALGAPGFGVVTIVTQALFVLSFATRAGMDMAVLREVAVARGASEMGSVRPLVARAAAIAAAASVLVGLGLLMAAPQVRALFSIDPERGRGVVEAAALGLPAIALTNVWLAATRGLKLMRPTLYVFWIGQPAGWIALMVIAWSFSRAPGMTVAAYSMSWWLAAAAAAAAWHNESARWRAGARPDMGRVARYAAPRAPAALLAQLLFWVDLFVLTRYASAFDVGVYSAALRAGQITVLLLASVGLMFSPYVADLHARGEVAKLDALFKTLTRWTLTLTLPGFLLLAVAPAAVLRLFGGTFTEARTALLILLAGQLVNVATGSAGFVLIMAGRTGWDLAVYAASFVAALLLSLGLIPRYGIEGAALANAAVFAASNLVRLALVRRFVGIWPYDRRYLRLLPPTALGVGAMGLLRMMVPDEGIIGLVIVGLGGALVYAAAVFTLAVSRPPGRMGPEPIEPARTERGTEEHGP